MNYAESLKPTLHETIQQPLAIVHPVADSSLYLRWRMEVEAPGADLSTRLLHKGDTFILDFNGHRTGNFAFRLIGDGVSVDAPTRLRLTFGEVPGDVAEPLYPKVAVSGPDRQISWASQAWLTLGGVLNKDEATEALRRAVIQDKTATQPTTAYLYHHVAEAMVECGMRTEALELIQKY